MEELKVELKESLERFKGYNQAHFTSEYRQILQPLHDRAVEIAEQHDFIEVDPSSEESFTLRVKFGPRYAGKIFVKADFITDEFNFIISEEINRESTTVRTGTNKLNLLVSRLGSNGNPFSLETKAINPDYIDYLLNQLLKYLNQEIEEEIV